MVHLRTNAQLSSISFPRTRGSKSIRTAKEQEDNVAAKGRQLTRTTEHVILLFARLKHLSVSNQTSELCVA